MKFGAVQGRLTTTPNGELQYFPDNWQTEFMKAKDIDLNFIELLTERKFNSNNPFWTDSGRSEIKKLSHENGLSILTSCTDYIIDNSIINNQKTLEHVKRFLESSSDLGIKKAVFPLLEKSEITKSNMNSYVPVLKNISDYAADLNVEIVLETLLNAKDLIKLLSLINRENTRCVFDTGNRAIFNEPLDKEIMLLGDLITHVHIKDKNSDGENVLLGTGLVNFKNIFQALKNIKYDGNFVFETTRGINPIETMKYNINFCKFFANQSTHS